MAKKISLTINAKRYDIDIDDAFAPFFESSMAEDFNIHGNNDLKVLLQAYVRKCFELYKQEKAFLELLQKLDTIR